MEGRTPLRIAYVASYLPRECGIATFTHSVLHSVERLGESTASLVVAVNQPGDQLEFPAQVVAQIQRDDPDSYAEAARFLNAADVDVVNVQHEYGLFGGVWGSHLLRLIDGLRTPVVLTLHTVLPSPDGDLVAVTGALVERSASTTVLAEVARDILTRDYGVQRRKLQFIPHGAPNVPPDQHRLAKRRLGVASRPVLATCGLISPGKGIEYALRAVAGLVERFPDLVYIVAGETHPGVRAVEGERYRTQLEDEVRALGLRDHVQFVNRYLSYPELVDYLLACDVYVVPYLNLHQIVSGTLAYALGCGCAIVSTPSLYASEVLADGRGLLVPLRDAEAMRDAVASILADPELAQQLRDAAYAYGHQMSWPNVGRAYLDLFVEVSGRREALPKAG
jgi:glycosyltransferase involved in cell wall biosynthesis